MPDGMRLTELTLPPPPLPRPAWHELDAGQAAGLAYREVEADWRRFWAGELPNPPFSWCPWRDAPRALAWGAFYGRLVEGGKQAWELEQLRWP